MKQVPKTQMCDENHNAGGEAVRTQSRENNVLLALILKDDFEFIRKVGKEKGEGSSSGRDSMCTGQEAEEQHVPAKKRIPQSQDGSGRKARDGACGHLTPRK